VAVTIEADVSPILEMLGLTAEVRRPTTSQVLEYAAAALFRMGFERVRYYNYSEEAVPELPSTSTVYLAWQRNADGSEHFPQPVGYPIRWDKTSLAESVRAPTSRRVRPIVRSSRHGNHQAPNHDWVDELDLLGRSWVDIPVHDQVKLLGLLAADWRGSPSEICKRDLDTLGLLGSVLGGELSAATPRISDALMREIEALDSDSTSNRDFVVKAASRIRDAVGASTAAIFRFSWTNQAVARVAWADTPQPPYDETYRVGEFLTGKAWNDSRYRRILDFARLASTKRELVNDESLRYHEQVHGSVGAVRYGRIGLSNPHYLIRLINTESDRSGPFLFEQDTLEEIISRLSQLYDARIISQRASFTTRLLDLLAAHAQPQAVLSETVSALTAVEGLRDFAVIAFRVNDRRPYFYHGVRPDVIGRIRDTLLADGPFVEASNSQPTFLYPSAGALGTLICEEFPGSQGLATYAFASGQTRGALMLPLFVDRSALVLDPELRSYRAAHDFLHQLASIAGQSLEDEIIRIQSTHALRALSLVGHEMVTPLAAMTKLTEQALQAASRYSTRILKGENPQPVSPTVYNDLRSRILQNTELLEAGIRLGQLVGRQNDGRLVGVMRKVELATLLNRATNSVRTEITRGFLYCPGRLILKRGSQFNSATFSCDAPLVEAILTNLYRNAVKYSIPSRSEQVEITTRVSRPSTRLLEVVIENFGLHIPEFGEELIFQPFVRFAAEHDSAVGRRGMGLGLFLARNIAKAHGGDAALQVHEQLSRSEARAFESGEVYRTAFSLRLRTDLPPGDYVYTLRDEDVAML
jgi:signal transduction histidine kinase